MEQNNNPQSNQHDDLLRDFGEDDGLASSSQQPSGNDPLFSEDMDLERILEEAKAAEDMDSALFTGESAQSLPDAPISPEDAVLEQIMEEARADALPNPAEEDAGNSEFFPGEAGALSREDTQFFTPAEFDYTQELPHTDFAPMSEASAPLPKVENKATEADLEDSGESLPKKRRPERKKGYGLFGLPHIVSTFVWLAIVVAIGVTLGRMVWVCASDMLAFNKPYVSAVITITEDETLDDIIEDLEDAGLIRYPVLFKFFANIKGGREEISNGTFTFTNDRLYDYNAIMNNVNPNSSGREVVEDVVIPEGYTCAQIFALLEERGVCSAADLEEYCASGEVKDYWFLEGVERGDKYCLEGYLFPNTYDFYKDDSPAHVIGKMLSSFDDNYTDIMVDKLAPLNERLAATLANRGYSQEYINAHKITIREIVIIASMIERESTDGPERFKISGVIYNRLTNPKEFPKLQIDATIVYALGGNLDENGNSKPLTTADLAFDSPYNTYLYDGLTPGPIANPGAASINAALDPNDEGYYFYVYNPAAGEHIFSKTLEEHEEAIASVRNQG